MAKALSVDSSQAQVTVTGFDVSVSYEISVSITEEQATGAISKSAGVPSSAVDVTIAESAVVPMRRLSRSRRLGSFVEATIRTDDATTAKSVMSKASSIAELQSELSLAGIEGELAMTVAPAVEVKTEIKVLSSSGWVKPDSKKLAEVGLAVGGIVDITELKRVARTTTTTRTVPPILSANPARDNAHHIPLWLILATVGTMQAM